MFSIFGGFFRRWDGGFYWFRTFQGWFGGRFLIRVELRKLVRKRVRENHVKNVVIKNPRWCQQALFFHASWLCRCLWQILEAFFVKQFSRNLSRKFSLKFSQQNSHRIQALEWSETAPSPPLKHPGPLKSHVAFPETVAEYTTHDSGHPAPRSSDVIRKHSLFQTSTSTRRRIRRPHCCVSSCCPYSCSRNL